jgi:hypothetical protein
VANAYISVRENLHFAMNGPQLFLVLAEARTIMMHVFLSYTGLKPIQEEWVADVQTEGNPCDSTPKDTRMIWVDEGYPNHYPIITKGHGHANVTSHNP